MDAFETAKSECGEIVRGLKATTKPYLAGIYGSFQGGNHGELIGTGVFIRHQGSVFVLTAGHNLAKREARDNEGNKVYEDIVVTGEPGSPPQIPIGRFATWPQPYDLGLAAVTLPAGSQAFDLHGAGVAPFSNNYKKDVLFIHGLPGARSHPVFGVHSNTLPFAAAYRASQYDWFQHELHVSIQFSPADLFDEEGNAADFVAPNGLSGCPIWVTGRNRCASMAAWTPTSSLLVGIIHNWDDKALCLIGTRIEIVRQFVEVAAAAIRAAT